MRAPALLTACLALAAMLAAPLAQAWEEPRRGTQLRKDLMNAIRPLAEEFHGAPLIFVVDTLRVSGNVGFGALRPMRPGGNPELLEREYLARNDVDLQSFSGLTIYVVYQSSGGIWRVLDWAAQSSDVWWVSYCPSHRPVLPDVCQ